MSLRRSSPQPPRAAIPVAADFAGQFVIHAHVIVAEGYSRLDPATLAGKEEPDISGLIVRNSRAWMDDPMSPAWTQSYFVTEEKFEDASSLEGMRRPRIDVHVESNARRPRPRFVFEAKRLYRGDSVAEYVGPKGLGALCDGTYASNAEAAGMLGYVQHGKVDDGAERVCRKLDRERRAHHLSMEGPVWEVMELDPRMGATRRSRHLRPGRPRIDVYHSFLKCCDMTLDSPPDAEGGEATSSPSPG